MRGSKELRAQSRCLQRRAAYNASGFIEQGQCDIVAQFCAPVPTIVVLNWLGLPDEDWKVWSDAVLNQFSPAGT